VTAEPSVSFTPQGVRFAVTAREAERVELCLFADGQEHRLPMARDGDLHRLTVPGIGEGQGYGYRATGPWDPDQGLFHDACKLLVDPYAQQLDGRFVFDPHLAQRGFDTAALVPKALMSNPAQVAPQPPLFRPGGFIYEVNVRGFTMRHPEVPDALRGTIAALAHPAVIAHLQKLGVDAVELMPVAAWIDERHLPALGLRNAWGYNPVAPMALDPGLAPGGIAELRQTVATLRAAGIGVILDLVLNHSGEGDAQGPILSMRGLDRRYYARDGQGRLINDTGTGNTLDAAQPMVRRLMIETLRHFARHCGVDGFRLDLATVLARGPGFDPQAPIFDDIAGDPWLADRVMIAEPWDIGPGGYQLGNFPPRWLEWNDRYRDDVRRFWRGDPGMTGVLATRMMGSSDIFHGPASRSVNFLAAHDGMTLADIVAYRNKHNAANGEHNRDGQDENYSWNHGVEGASDDPAIRAARAADLRALLATLFASRGTIMLTAGDEFGRSQRGNNNAYAQDALLWLDWENRDHALEDQVAALSHARKARGFDSAFLNYGDWYDLTGAAMTDASWNDPASTGFRLIAATGMLTVDRSARQVSF
jgi:glycogen operon protein